MDKRIIGLLICILVVSGCAPQWKRVSEKNRVIQQQGLQLELPINWVTIASNKKSQFTSFDGPSLNAIVMETIEFKDVEKKLKIKLTEELDVLTASKHFLAYWSKTTGISEFSLDANSFIDQDGISYFKLSWHFVDTDGVTVKSLVQGTILRKNIVVVGYSAPKTYYFDKTFVEFEKVLQTIKING